MKNFFKELSHGYRIYKMSSNPSIEHKLNDNNIYVDWVGRPYFFIPIPDEYLSSTNSLDSLAMLKIKEYGQILANLGFRGYLSLFPQYTIDSVNKKILIIFTYEYIFLRNWFIAIILSVILSIIAMFYFL